MVRATIDPARSRPGRAGVRRRLINARRRAADRPITPGQCRRHSGRQRGVVAFRGTDTPTTIDRLAACISRRCRAGSAAGASAIPGCRAAARAPEATRGQRQRLSHDRGSQLTGTSATVDCRSTMVVSRCSTPASARAQGQEVMTRIDIRSVCANIAERLAVFAGCAIAAQRFRPSCARATPVCAAHVTPRR